MSKHPAVLTVRQLRRDLDRMVGSPSKSHSCLSKQTTALVDSLLRHGDYDHVRTSVRKSALMRDIADNAGFDFDTDDWRSPRQFTKPELIAIHEAVWEEVSDG